MKPHSINFISKLRADLLRGTAVGSSLSILSTALLCLTGCGPDKGTADSGAPSKAGESTPTGTVGTAAAKAGPAAGGSAAKVEVPDVPPKGPATPAEAAQMLDLNKVSLSNGTSIHDAEHTIANLRYKTTGSVKDAFEFHRKELLAQRWKEMPNSYVTEQSASATFARNTFHVSLSVMPDSEAGKVMIMIHNHGNVNLAKLPRPPVQKTVYEGELSAIYVTDTSVAEAAEACRKLLIADGWEPYGGAGDVANFKQNGVIIGARATSAPAEGGKTMIMFSKEMMSSDLPAPPDAEDVRYIDSYRRLTFETAASKEAVADYYKQKLAKTGWKPNKDGLIDNVEKSMMVFREPTGGLLFLDIMPEYKGKRKVQVAGTTMAEFDEASKRVDKKVAAEVEKKKEQENKPKPKVVVKLPVGAEGVKLEKEKLEFTTGSGKAKGITEAWQKQYVAEGWKEDRANLSTAFGSLALSKEGQNLSINYTDTGVMPAEFTIYTIGAELERQ